MRKELIAIFFFFLVALSLISLLTYNPADPSMHNATAASQIHNWFGIIGAHLSGLLIGFFGLGAFWIPVLLTILGIRLIREASPARIGLIASGGLLLIITTGALFAAVGNDQTNFLGRAYTSGGMLGIPITLFFKKYAGLVGGIIILLLLWIVAFLLTTGFSLGAILQQTLRFVLSQAQDMQDFYIRWKAKREKKKTSPLARKITKEPAAEIAIKTPAPRPEKKTPVPRQEEFSFMRSPSDYHPPEISFLKEPGEHPASADEQSLRKQSLMVESKLEDFDVKGNVISIMPGPVITTFEYKPAPGIKINKIVNLSDDLAMALRAVSIRIAPIPGHDAIGIEIPNANRETVCIRDVLISGEFEKTKARLPICLGKDIIGNPVIGELEKMPHLLIAGATGAGKSVCLNVIITSLLYRSSPDDVKFIMIDPKRIELSGYDGIPHLISPVVTDMKKATNAMMWAVREMERRYELLRQLKKRDIINYNKAVEKEQPKKASEDGQEETPLEKLPYIVIIIDELADLMMVASREVEVCLARLAQMARAAGIHLIIATQRPSVDVLTGVIKANFPTRISFQVSSKTDSRTILDSNGAENLLGSGDMLYLPPGTARVQRIHGAFISDEELHKVIDHLKKQKPPEYIEQITAAPSEENGGGEVEYDEKYDEAVALVTRTGQASISMVQRHLRIGYNRAARIIETMETEGVVGPSDGVKPREVLARNLDDPS